MAFEANDNEIFYFSDDYYNHNRVANPMPVTLLLQWAHCSTSVFLFFEENKLRKIIFGFNSMWSLITSFVEWKFINGNTEKQPDAVRNNGLKMLCRHLRFLSQHKSDKAGSLEYQNYLKRFLRIRSNSQTAGLRICWSFHAPETVVCSLLRCKYWICIVQSIPMK